MKYQYNINLKVFITLNYNQLYDKENIKLKSKHINIRITPEVNRQIESIKKEMIDKDSMPYSRSQVLFMLIVKGIEKYTEMQLNKKT